MARPYGTGRIEHLGPLRRGEDLSISGSWARSQNGRAPQPHHLVDHPGIRATLCSDTALGPLPLCPDPLFRRPAVAVGSMSGPRAFWLCDTYGNPDGMTSPAESPAGSVERGTLSFDDAVRTAADRLRRASATCVPCRPVRDLIGSADVRAAYLVQSTLSAERLASGARRVGHKVGLTSSAVQSQLGVDQPDFGSLFDDMSFFDGDSIPVSRLLQPKVEAEVAFVLGADMTAGPFEVQSVRPAVAYAVAAIEVVDSRITDWDITFADTVADNASSGLFVLGPQRRTLTEVEPADVSMTMTVNGEVLSSGAGRACLGDPLNALAWLANTALELGEPLRAGQIVLSGALGPMYPIRSGEVVRVDITDLGSVTASFTDQLPEEGQ